jgi:hypothetical protein
VNLERGPLSLVYTTEELLGRKSCDSILEIREYGRRDASRWPSDTFCPQEVGTNKRRSLCQYSSLADSGHGKNVYSKCSGFTLHSTGSCSCILMYSVLECDRVVYLKK